MAVLVGVGLAGGKTALSTYGASDSHSRAIQSWADAHPQLVEGPQWFQSDHAAFAQRGRPALALTSEDFARALGEIAHSPDDLPDVLDLELLAALAGSLADLVPRLP